MKQTNGKVRSDLYRGTRLVHAPPARWYHFSLPCSSELERMLQPARNHEEDAILIAPDSFTAFMLRLESFGPRIPVVIGERQARRMIDERLLESDTSAIG
jgi:hypothetical protein